MTRFSAVTLCTVFLIINVNNTVNLINTHDVLYELNDRIFSITDDLFISLRINTKMITPKNADEYMVMHSYVQEMLRRNHKRYKEISDVIKITINNKTADQIAGVNEVIDEMISEHAVKNNDSTRNSNETKFFTESDKLKGFVDLVRALNLKTNELTPNDLTVWSPNASLEVGPEGRRIFAGSNTAITRYPFMVSVHLGSRFVCAGSLLHESLAITAASCLMRVRNDPDVTIQIRVGSDYATKSGYVVAITRLFFHPEFDRTTLANNLVLLKTRKALRFIPKKVVAIKYDKYEAQSAIKDAKSVVILGWGRRGPTDKRTINEKPLSRARIDVYDLEECKYIYTKEYVTDKNFCAGFVDRGEGACNHDGGGPALVGSLLVGVISFGSPRCGRVDAPTVFTRLGLYSTWIQSTLDSVTLKNGKLNNPQQFEVPASIEIGIGSEELDNEKTDNENPREKLEKEFGIKDILQGPIDTNDWKYNYSKNANYNTENEGQLKSMSSQVILNRESAMGDILAEPVNKPKDEFLKSTIKPYELASAENLASVLNKEIPGQSQDTYESSDMEQIKLSEESESNEIIFSTPTVKTINKALKTENFEESDNGEVLSDIMKHFYQTNNRLKVNINITKTSKGIYDDETEKVSTSQLESPSKRDIGLNIKTTKDETFKFNLNPKAKTIEGPKPYETSQYDVTFQIDIKPIYIKKSKDNKNPSVIISESGTTERIELKASGVTNLKDKLTEGIGIMIKDMDSGRVKKRRHDISR